MKDFKHLLLFAAILFAGLLPTACSSDDDEKTSERSFVIDEQVQNVEYEIITDKIVRADELVDEAISRAGVAGSSEIQLLRTMFLSKQQDIANAYAEQLGVSLAVMGFRSVSYAYWSVDERGEAIKLSARALWGSCMTSQWNDIDPACIVLFPHYTITANSESPSQSHTYEAIAACGDNLLILPDYIGFGVAKDRTQPYINHNLCAQNCIDALKAGYKVFRDLSEASLAETYKLCVVGASQGGGNALAIHKWLDTHDGFATDWRFDYSMCCAGPYSPTLTYDKYFELNSLADPCVLPLTLQAMRNVAPAYFEHLPESDFYTADYAANHMAEMNQMITSKEYTTGEINAKFFEWYPAGGGHAVRLTDILSAEALNTNSVLYEALFKCLKENDLTQSWQPIHTINIYHDKSDDVVPYANAEALQKAFPDKVVLTATNTGGGHTRSCLLWMVQLMSHKW
ncbi:MAG: hypothetical protein J6Y82_12120 [Bacteroidales bacterium]|nr:hypothetical protein [Bacteroidales bacterium]